jgi:cyclopropane-fatty-acyl-phospholipid synthase
MSSSRDYFTKILSELDIQVGDDRPHDIRVHNDRVFDKVLAGGSLALGESYMDGDWECDDLSEFFNKIFLNFKFQNVEKVGLFKNYLRAKFLNLQSGKKAFQVAEEHYDLGNDLYKMMLDVKTRSYTCAYYKNGDEVLEEAQVAKLDLICRKLNLKKGDRVLDIGCGWGNFMKYAAEKYGAICTGLSVSKEQIKLGQELCHGLPVEFIFTNYQDYKPKEQFDHIVSIEMFEAVGRKNFKSFFEFAASFLKDEGLFVLQTIASRDKSNAGGDPWIDKYIFPNGELPTLGQICDAIEHPRGGLGSLMIEDVHNIGADYDKTLMSWWDNFDNGYEELCRLNPKYDARFYRMWKYYLQYCAGMFRSRRIQDYQLVLSKIGLKGGYVSVR